MKRAAIGALAALVFLLGTALGNDPAEGQERAKRSKSKKKKGWDLRLWDQISLRHGNALRINLEYRLQTDFLGVDPDPEVGRDLFEVRRNRVGVSGTFLRDFEFEYKYDFGRAESATRDAYVNYRRIRSLQLQAGRFKLPFGRDMLRSPKDLDFVYRSRLGAEIAPARQTGLMLHGPVFGRALRYQAGMFLHDGENSYGADNVRGGGRIAAVRVRSEPAQYLRLPGVLQNLEAAAAITRGSVKEGRFGLRGRTVFGTTFFPRRDARGHRTRVGAEVSWMPGPLALEAEYAYMTEQRIGQGLRSQNLPNVNAHAWYVAGAWVITGEEKRGGVRPRKPLFQGGFGAAEFAVRQEYLGFGSAPCQTPPSLSPRACTVLKSHDRASTFGVNWYPNRFVKLLANFVREEVHSPYLDWDRPRQLFWTRALRLQFVF